MKTAIEINDVTFQHKSQSGLFENLSLQFRMGMIHGLLAKKGEGKSSLLKLICGVYFPSAGSISTLGFDPAERKPVMLSNIFFVPEEMNKTTLGVKTFERVYAPFYDGFSSSEFYQYMHKLLVDTSCENISLMTQPELQRFFIAFGLATNAKVILLDEPTAEMEDATKVLLKDTLIEARKKNNCIIVSSSDVPAMQGLVDNVIILRHHKIVLNETVDQITKRLIFTDKYDESLSVHEIYSEKGESGVVRRVYKNIHAAEGELDIELLFNAVTYEKNSTIDAFGK